MFAFDGPPQVHPYVLQFNTSPLRFRTLRLKQILERLRWNKNQTGKTIRLPFDPSVLHLPV